MKEIMISGVSSGVGKTTITLGLMEVLKRRGYTIQPYKVGPDYIDTAFHRRLCERPSINLDEFLVPNSTTLQALYLRALNEADISVIEGVMGFYDGFGIDKSYCSSAGIARKLKIPVVLVIDGQGTSTSAAAVVKGFMEFDKEINFIGVIINRVASYQHYQLIKQAVEQYNSIEVLGYLKKDMAITIPSRHLGLVPESELLNLDEKLNTLAKEMEKTIEVDRLLELSDFHINSQEEINRFVEKNLSAFTDNINGKGLKIAYAKDAAFSFYYPDNLTLLESIGIELISFSPLKDNILPKADAYYFGGGFPELYVKELSQNNNLKQEIRLAFQTGKSIFAECGGLMYLGEKFEERDGSQYSLVGLIPGKSYMTPKLKRFGYCKFFPEKDIEIAEKNWELRGHEFHHSDFHSESNYAGYSHKERDGQIIKRWQSGYQINNLFASYLHIHFYQHPNFIKHWINNIKEGNKTL